MDGFAGLTNCINYLSPELLFNPTTGFKTREVRLKPDATFGFETGSRH
jgi:hypothetical protein